MIGRIKDPTRPDRDVYVPLRWNSDRNTWEELGEPRGRVPLFQSSIDAAIVCWDHLRARYRKLMEAARLLRVMCEHPSVKFETDAMTPAMLHRQARALTGAMGLEREEINRLLDDPGVNDLVHIRDERHVLNLNTMRLEPCERGVAPPLPMPPREAQARHEWLVRICILFAEEFTGEQHSPLQIEGVVNRVQERLRDEGIGGKTPH